MLTFATLADDLAAYRRYIEDEDIDFLEFGPHRLRRPTYRYNAALTIAVESGEVAPTVAKRRMATTIRFYRWLIDECYFRPSYPAWRESDRYVHWENEYGGKGTVAVKTTDVTLRTPVAEDPWDDTILDGGRLRPLPQHEQAVLLTTLQELSNTEMSLIHLVSLISGVRIQTVLTMRIRHFAKSPEEIAGNHITLKAGPGTGIDTKLGKRGRVHLPKWLYERLHVYSRSERARKRRLRAHDGDHSDQFLFLSNRGAVFYEARNQRHQGNAVRHAKTGQAVRQFIREKLLPKMRAQLKNPVYSFSFHDLRATFGMNFVDSQSPLLEAGKVTYSRVLDTLRELMWHSSAITTERYLKYRTNLLMLEAAEQGWHQHLERLSRSVLKENGNDVETD